MKALFSIKQITNWLLSKSKMSPKKLQKMLYYEYSWLLVALNNTPNLQLELFKGHFQAWAHGPVDPSIYKQFKKYKYHTIDYSPKKPNLEKYVSKKLGNIHEAQFVIKNMEFIFNLYNRYNADQLELATHEELPWKEARKGYLPLDASNVPLNKHVIYNYYHKAAGFKR